MATSIMAADWLGLIDTPVTREQAMRVPAVVAARNLICTGLAQGVLKAFKADLEVTTPAWMYRTDSDLPPLLRLLWTVDDLFFGGYSVWQVSRGSNRAIGDAVRVTPNRWTFSAEGVLLVDGQPAKRDDFVVFVGWDEGLLLTGNVSMRAALDLQDEVARRVRVPQAHTTLKVVDQSLNLTNGTENPDDNEQQDLVDGFTKARQSKTGAVSLLPYGIDVVQGGEVPVSLYEQGRNASVLDIARLTGVPASMLDASAVAASLTYETKSGARPLFNERLRARAAVIEARLSMDDVLPRGQRCVLDLSHLQTDETGTPAVTED
ncbi:hypothetical protein [Cellulomonas sp. SG140]|uniref:hypothetical protein n=1 Tax=Cellulomonas sp. SG140 TaxID=2976536 RepID=UPI0021E93201|nr:hypothetical protein [Cellulomonas sp. SG140]